MKMRNAGMNYEALKPVVLLSFDCAPAYRGGIIRLNQTLDYFAM